MSPGNALDITPSISPFFSNNPAFKVFTFASGTFTPIDYRSLNYDLATMPAQFNPYYTFSQAYSLTNAVPLDTNFSQLYPQLVTNGVHRSTYIDHFNSGNNTAGATPITPANWPVFACGISNMAQSDFIRCVNNY